MIAYAQPALDQVSVSLLGSSSMSILDQDLVLYVARAASHRIMSVALHVGNRLPAYCTSMGQVLLAALEAPELEAHLARTILHAHTRYTLTSKVQLPLS